MQSMIMYDLSRYTCPCVRARTKKLLSFFLSLFIFCFLFFVRFIFVPLKLQCRIKIRFGCSCEFSNFKQFGTSNNKQEKKTVVIYSVTFRKNKTPRLFKTKCLIQRIIYVSGAFGVFPIPTCAVVVGICVPPGTLQVGFLSRRG